VDDLDLSPLVRSILAATRVSRAAPRADPATFAAWLDARGYPAHEAVLGFEARYGGLQVFETDPVAPALLVGPFACLADGKYKGKERDLVPVMFAWGDVVYSLDAEGRGFACACMVEGVARFAARDGSQLLTQAILWRRLLALWERPPAEQRVSEDVDGLHGAARAAALGLGPLSEASSDVERWWGDRDHLVVEIQYGNGYAGPRTSVAA
jgi:hypothetical protein